MLKGGPEAPRGLIFGEMLSETLGKCAGEGDSTYQPEVADILRFLVEAGFFLAPMSLSSADAPCYSKSHIIWLYKKDDLGGPEDWESGIFDCLEPTLVRPADLDQVEGVSR